MKKMLATIKPSMTCVTGFTLETDGTLHTNVQNISPHNNIVRMNDSRETNFCKKILVMKNTIPLCRSKK
jgi:hypothetical protein